MNMTNTHPRLKERGLSDTTLQKLSVTPYVKTGINPQDQWVSFPYIKNGKEVNAKIRDLNGGKEMRFAVPGVDAIVYNHDCLLDEELINEPLIITEGEIDCLSALEASYRRVISVPNGAPAKKGDTSSKRYEPIRNILHLIDECREIVLATDDDEPGANLASDLSKILGRTRCKVLKYPKGCKDLNEALEKYKVEGVRETIKRARWVEIDGVYEFNELEECNDYKYLQLGWSLDENFKIAKGQFSVVTGIPSHGKTTFINELCCRIVQKHKWKIAMASFEQHPMRMHRRNLVSWIQGQDFQQQSKGSIEIGDQWIQDNFIFVVPGIKDDISLEWMMEKMSAAVVRHDIDMIVIDPWNEMDHFKDYNESLTEYTGRAIKTFKAFADKKNIHVMVVAHPTKMIPKEDGKYRVPALYDISDSAHWNNKPDLGLVVYRDFDLGTTEIHAKKVRDEPAMGKPGMKDLVFDSKRCRFVDA